MVNINEKYVTPEFLSAMKENGLGISAWTVNEPERIREFLDLEICNITTRNFRGGHGASTGCQSAVTQNTVK